MAMLRTADAVADNPWRFCLLCGDKHIFTSSDEFRKHLRFAHCTKEGGSYVCHYGKHGVCQSLPLEGVNNQDYEDHVEKVHILLDGRVEPDKLDTTSSRSLVAKPKIPLFKVDNIKTWTHSSSQNLSTVLNDPRRHGRQADFFTQLWGEGFVPHSVVPLTRLPNVPRIYFEDHIKRMEFKYMAHQKIKRAAAQSTEFLAPGSLPGDFGFSRAANANARSQTLDGPEGEHDEIPEIFLHANFSLEDPSTFNRVLPWSSVHGGKRDISSIRPMSPKKSRKLLQEQLSHYLDTTEVRLAQQIASRSDDFFRTMSSQEQLQSDVSNTCTDVRHLRMQMSKIEGILIKRTLDVMRLFRLRSRHLAVEEKLKLMATIHQTQPTIQILLSTSDFVSALDLIDTSLEILQQELAGVQCLRHLGSQLSEMKNIIERMMEADFVDFAVENLNRTSKNVDSDELYEEDRLLSVVLGLLRQKRFRFLHLYKDEVYAVIKLSIKQVVHDTVFDQNQSDNEDENHKVGDSIRAVTHQEWVQLMENVFQVSLNILKRVKLIHESFVKVLTIAVGMDVENQDFASDRITNQQESEPATLLSSNEYNRLSSESKELTWSACELAQIRCSKLINMRAKGGALDQLSSGDFVFLARIVEGFVGDCEGICGRQSHNLRGTLLSQAKRFIEKFHEERKQKLGLILDNERWKQANVPYEFQALVNSISNGIESSSSSPKLKREEEREETRKASDHLVIKGQNFVVVGTLLLFIKMVIEYCQCVDDAPMLTSEILTKLCEIMKIYNSRLCQLVLGAGALKTVGLKTITAKHLGLAAQCLEVVIFHIPIFKTHFEIRVPPKQYVLLSQFDQILKDYSNHRHEIISKIVSLMDEVFTSHLEKYAARPPMPSSSMRAIVKQILKLHETLNSVFQEQQMESLFRDIRRSFKNCLAEKLASLKIINDGSPQSGLVTSDMAFFSESLKNCPGLSDLGQTFDGIWTTVKEIRKRKLNGIENKLPQR